MSTEQKLVRKGDRGELVVALQSSLKALGHAVDVDGVFGPATEQAVKTLQTALGIPADGIVGPKTREAIDKAAATMAKKATDAAMGAIAKAQAKK
jgi:peptidoglycan DL-endopeptidase CwlO